MVPIAVWLDVVAESFFAESADEIVGDVVFFGQLGEKCSGLPTFY